MKSDAVREQLAELHDEKKALDMIASKGTLSEEQETRYEALLDQIEAGLAKLTVAERAESVDAQVSQPMNPAPVALEIRNVADEAPYSFGEFLRDVANSTRTQFQDQSKRLTMHQKRNIDLIRKEYRAATGSSEAIPSDGGFLVGQEFAAGLIDRMYDNSAVASRCVRTPIGPGLNGLKMNGVDETSRANGSRFGGVVGYWVAEAATITSSKPAFRQIELNLKKVAALWYGTDELLQDATAMSSVAERAVVGELEFMIQDAIVNGNGAGKPLGFLQSPALVTITKETGQDADTVVFENISKMWAAMWARSRPNSVWLINQEIEPQLDKLAIPVGTGGLPVYMPPGGLSASPYGTIKGRPVIAIEQAAALGDAGDISLADLSQYQIIDKGGVQAASSIHVQFVTDEVAFRFIVRIGGQPLWNSALTPYKGAQTLSPFVTLGART